MVHGGVVWCTQGLLRLRDLVALLPMPDQVVVLAATGAQLVEALENGVSQV